MYERRAGMLNETMYMLRKTGSLPGNQILKRKYLVSSSEFLKGGRRRSELALFLIILPG